MPISMTMTDDEISSIIRRWLSDDAARVKRAKKGQDYFKAKFSSEKYVEEVIRWVGLVKADQRGLVTPHAWDFIGAELPWDG